MLVNQVGALIKKFSSPTSEPTGAPIKFNDRPRIDVLVAGSLSISDDSPETEQRSADSVDDVFITTISDIAIEALDPDTQRLQDVIVTSLSETTVEYDLQLTEICSSTCTTQAIGSTMAATVIEDIGVSIANGSFTTDLQTNAAACVAEACRPLDSTSVDDGTFEEPVVTIETTTPTLLPTVSPPTADVGTSPPTAAPTAKSAKSMKKKGKSKSAKTHGPTIASTKSAKTKSPKLAKLETKEEVIKGSEGSVVVPPAVSSELEGDESAADAYLVRSRRHSNEFEDEE